MTTEQPFRPTRQKDIIDPSEKLEAALGDTVRAVVSIACLVAIDAGRVRLLGEEWQRLERVHVLLEDAVSHALENARRGRL